MTITSATTTTISEAVESMIPQIAAEVYTYVAAQVAATLNNQDGKIRRDGKMSRAAYQFAGYIRSFCADVPADETDDWSFQSQYNGNPDWTIVPERVARFAAATAIASAHSWETKLIGKLGAVTDVTIEDHGAGNLTVRGTFDGSAVTLEQQRIINVSSHGKLFHQFPARIYVDGKATAERAFKGLTGTAAAKKEA